MTLFWGITLLMLGVALLFLLPPLWGFGRRNSLYLGEEGQLALYNDRLAELERDRAFGKLDTSQYALARTDLDRELLQDAQPEGSSAPVGSSSKERWLAPILLLLVPTLALSLYGQLGEEKAFIPEPVAVAAADKLPPMDKVVTLLENKLKANPEDGEGWRLLARSYVVLEQYTKANQAYARARELLGDQVGLLVDMAESSALSNGDRFIGAPARLLQLALQQQPNHPKGLWLSGIAAYQEAQFSLAIQVWESLLQQGGSSEELNQILRQYIVEARTHLSQPATTAALADTTTLQVRVVLDTALAHQISPEHSLFIFARPAQGLRMPLAIARLQASDLPAEVELNDGMAMLPNRRLSDFSAVVVGARISKTGQGLPQTGDLQGLSETLNLPLSELVTVVINQVVP